MRISDWSSDVCSSDLDWPDSLGLDAVVIALSAGERAVRAGTSGVQMVAPAYIDVAVAGPPVVMRSVEQGDGVFGPASELIRAEALIRLDLPQIGRASCRERGCQ